MGGLPPAAGEGPTELRGQGLAVHTQSSWPLLVTAHEPWYVHRVGSCVLSVWLLLPRLTVCFGTSPCWPPFHALRMDRDTPMGRSISSCSWKQAAGETLCTWPTMGSTGKSPASLLCVMPTMSSVALWGSPHQWANRTLLCCSRFGPMYLPSTWWVPEAGTPSFFLVSSQSSVFDKDLLSESGEENPDPKQNKPQTGKEYL